MMVCPEVFGVGGGGALGFGRSPPGGGGGMAPGGGGAVMVGRSLVGGGGAMTVAGSSSSSSGLAAAGGVGAGPSGSRVIPGLVFGFEAAFGAGSAAAAA